jgi:endoglucanase
VNYITNVKGMYCVLDLHNYHRYRGNVIGSSAVSYDALTDVWQKLAGVYKDNPRMIWGTMNEPYDVGYLAARLGANAAIKGIRNAGANQLVTLCGNDFSAVSTWVGTNSEWMGPANITDPQNNWYCRRHHRRLRCGIVVVVTLGCA